MNYIGNGGVSRFQKIHLDQNWVKNWPDPINQAIFLRKFSQNTHHRIISNKNIKARENLIKEGLGFVS